MDIFLTNVVVLVTCGVLFLIVTVGPLLVVPTAIWIGLWVFEAFISAFPLVGKPLARIPHKLRSLYEKLLKWCWGKIPKYDGQFFGAVWRGLRIVGGDFFSAVGRGIVRIKDVVVAKVKGIPTP